MKTRILAMVSAVLVLALAGCGGAEHSEKAAGTVALSARVETVTRVSVEDTYDAVGTVRSKTTSKLSSKIMAYVVAVRVKEGDRVKAGQLLIQLDDRDVAAQWRKATAGLSEAEHALEEVKRAIRASQAAKTAAEAHRALATSTYQRYQALLERRSVSRQEFDEVEAKYKAAVAEVNRADEMLQSLQARKSQVLAKIDQAKADVANARVYLGYARITSPISGLVTMKRVEVGDLAAPGVPLMTVEDSRAYRLEAKVEASQLPHIHVGEKATVLIDALGDAGLSATVSEIVPSADPASRSFIVKLDLPSNPLLRSGLFGRARFVIGQKQAIIIPRSALFERGQLTGVYVVDETNTARMRLVKTGKRYGDRMEVLSGLNDGERIIVEGIGRISDGSKIRGS